MKKFQTLLSGIILLASLLAQGQDIIISEFLAINNDVLQDEDGEFSDWIEIHNLSGSTIDLGDYYLTDDLEDLKKWQFPSQNLDAGAYVVVFASDKNRTTTNSELHTNFKLSGSGEYLALVEADGNIASYFDPFPVQQADVSYGLSNGGYTFFEEPSPGSTNQNGSSVDIAVFSHERGFYDTPFDITLTASNDGTVVYTMDGSIPNESIGTVFTSPLSIHSTTVLSAAIKDAQGKFGTVVSHTFIFPEDVCLQPNNPTGYPDIWSELSADYEMDPEVCTAENLVALKDALTDIPTISLVTDINHLFSDEDDTLKGGIYMFPLRTEDVWERPVSMEYIDPISDTHFQVNCGLRLHGGNSRKPYNSPKHGFRVSFRSKYGPSKLNFNLFEEGNAVNEFNNLVLRAGYNYSWIKNSTDQCANADYLRDPFAKKTQLDMDRTAAHSRFVHLYINGLYWGVYDLTEKINNDFVESYLGGSEDDYDVVKDHNGVTDGDREAWEALLAATNEGFESLAAYQKVQGKNEDGSKNPDYFNLLDIRNLSDYILINFYMGNKDWDTNNWLAARNKVRNDKGFIFFCWDAETSMVELEENIVEINNGSNPSWIFSKLMENEEYRIYFADRIHKHFYNGGDLTAEKTSSRYMEMADELGKAMMAESARWGDHRRDTDPGSEEFELYTYENHWLTRINYAKETYLPQRSEIVLNQLKEAGYYPEVEAPEFNNYGGEFESSQALIMTSANAEIYYTLDGTDPRKVGGAIHSNALSFQDSIIISDDAQVYARAKKDSKWSALTKAKFELEIEVIIDTVVVVDTVSVIDTVVVVDTIGVVDTVQVADTAKVLSHHHSPTCFYPNPAQDRLYFMGSRNQKVRVVIITLSGEYVREEEIEGDSYIDVSTLPKGFYLVRYKQGSSQTRQQKLVIQ